MPREHAGAQPARRVAATKGSGVRSPASKRKAEVRTDQQVADLAWAGQHAKAIELATASLAENNLDPAARLTLLDLRAESYVAQGDLSRAGADAAAMRALA